VDDSCLRQEWRICTLDAVVPRGGADAINIAAKWRWLKRRSTLACLGSDGLVHTWGGVTVAGERETSVGPRRDDRTGVGTMPNADGADVIALPPLIVLACLLIGGAMQIAYPLALLPFWMASGAGGLLLLTSIVVALSAVREFKKCSTPIDVRRPTTVIISSGIFRVSRNPLYLALVLLHAGIALLANSMWILMLLVPEVIALQIGVILREEAYLERRFGSDYTTYKARVRRWL
jgi:protein-S-isoprenylcysteine O-methyltransferase Ste14